MIAFSGAAFNIANVQIAVVSEYPRLSVSMTASDGATESHSADANVLLVLLTVVASCAVVQDFGVEAIHELNNEKTFPVGNFNASVIKLAWVN